MIRTSPWGRRSAGFSLDDAARIRTLIVAGRPVECPHCGFPLETTVGKDREPGTTDDARVCLVRCHGCGRSLVIRQPAGC